MNESLQDSSPDSDLGVLDELTVVRPRRREQPDSDMDITPMIDITFLLLIFFLVSSVVAQDSAVELPPAEHADAVSAKQSVIITVAELGEGDAVIYKGDGVDESTRLVSVDPVAQEQEIAEYVKTALAGTPPKQFVMIKAAKGVKHKHVARVSHAIGRVENVNRLFVAVLESD